MIFDNLFVDHLDAHSHSSIKLMLINCLDRSINLLMNLFMIFQVLLIDRFEPLIFIAFLQVFSHFSTLVTPVRTRVLRP